MKILNILAFLVFATSVGVTSADTGYSAKPVVSLENEIEEILLLASSAFRPDHNFLDARTKDFESEALAFLYLSAIKEQMRVMGLNIHAKVEGYSQKLRLNNAWHIFNNKEHELIAIKQWMRAMLVIFPDPNLFVKTEIEKIESFEQIEILRSQLLKQMLGSIAQTDDKTQITQMLVKKIKETIQNLPGNAQGVRLKYLKSLATRPEYNEDIRDLYENILYNVRLSDVVFKETETKSYHDALMFFRMLDSYFENFKADQNYVLWTKFLPIYEYKGLPQKAFLRFYITEKNVFINQVFENEIPIQIISSYRALLRRKGGIDKNDFLKAFSAILKFLNGSNFAFTDKSRQRITQSLSVIQSWAKQQVGVDEFEGEFAFEKFEPISGSLKLEVDHGPTLLADTVFAAHDVMSTQIGISYFKFDGDDFHVKVRKDEAKNLDISVRQDWGLLWMKSRLNSNVTTLDYESMVYEDRKNGAFAVRFLNGEPTVSSLILPLTSKGQRVFEEISMEQQVFNELGVSVSKICKSPYKLFIELNSKDICKGND